MTMPARPFDRTAAISGTVAALLALAASGCGTIQNTPAQEATLGAMRACDRFPGVWIDRVEPNGRYWVKYNEADQLRRFQECVATQRLDASKAQYAQAQPRDLLVRAYFVADPPPVGPLPQPPAPATEFKVDRPVVFFLNMYKSGQEHRATFSWLRPDGTVVVQQDRVLRDAAGASTRTWYVQTLPATYVKAAGRWSMDLAIDGQVIDTYRFSVAPP